MGKIREDSTRRIGGCWRWGFCGCGWICSGNRPASSAYRVACGLTGSVIGNGCPSDHTQDCRRIGRVSGDGVSLLLLGIASQPCSRLRYPPHRHLIHHTHDHGAHGAGVEPQDLPGAVPLVDHQHCVARSRLRHVHRDVVAGPRAAVVDRRNTSVVGSFASCGL
jgi:hypothetical protein